MLRKMLWKTFTLGDSCFPIHFLRFFPKLDKPQLVPFSLVHFFGMLNQIRKVSAGCTIGMVPLAGGKECQLLQNPIHSWRKIIQNRNENWKAGKQKKNIQTQRAKLTFMQKVFCENRWAWISERCRGGVGKESRGDPMPNTGDYCYKMQRSV